MEQGLIVLLESRVDGLLEKISALSEENRALKEELGTKVKALDEARSRIDELEGRKQAALEKIRAILEKIDGMEKENDSEPGINPSTDDPAAFHEGRGDQGHGDEGSGSLF